MSSRRTRSAFFTAAVVALGGPGLVTLLHFTSLRAVVPGLLYAAAIILATAVGGRIAGLAAVAASAYPFFHFFATATTEAARTPKGSPRPPCSSSPRCSPTRCCVGSARARRAPRRRFARARALEAASQLQIAADALATAQTPQEVLDAVLSEGVRAAEARSGLIATLSDDGETLDVIASRGYDEGRSPRISASRSRGTTRCRRRCGPAKGSSSAREGAGPAISRARRRHAAAPRARLPPARRPCRADRRPRILVRERPGVHA